MKRYTLLYIWLMLLTFQVNAQQSAEAERILEQTATTFENAGGVKATFRFEAFQRGNSLGVANGEIELKGERFFLKTAEHLSWFDGKTQWTYLPSSDEVTVTIPTEEELQSVNPYALLYIYKKGFTYEMGTKAAYRGKPVYEVILKAIDKKQELSTIVLYIDKESYQPVFIEVELRDKTQIGRAHV